MDSSIVHVAGQGGEGKRKPAAALGVALLSASLHFVVCFILPFFHCWCRAALSVSTLRAEEAA